MLGAGAVDAMKVLDINYCTGNLFIFLGKLLKVSIN
jgi:hypothetical protein